MKSEQRQWILLVEDNPHDAELIKRALSSQLTDCDIIHAKDGVEAVEILKEADGNPPKIVLLDCKLPRVSGIEVLKSIKSDESSKMLPVVIFSSSDMRSDIEAAYQHGVNSYLVKPINFEELETMLRAAAEYWLRINRVAVAGRWEGQA
jgi:CheY-like chemotaxis protein